MGNPNHLSGITPEHTENYYSDEKFKIFMELETWLRSGQIEPKDIQDLFDTIGYDSLKTWEILFMHPHFRKQNGLPDSFTQQQLADMIRVLKYRALIDSEFRTKVEKMHSQYSAKCSPVNIQVATIGNAVEAAIKKVAE